MPVEEFSPDRPGGFPGLPLSQARIMLHFGITSLEHSCIAWGGWDGETAFLKAGGGVPRELFLVPGGAAGSGMYWSVPDV